MSHELYFQDLPREMARIRSSGLVAPSGSAVPPVFGAAEPLAQSPPEATEQFLTFVRRHSMRMGSRGW